MAEPCGVERALIAVLYSKLSELSKLADTSAQLSAKLAHEDETVDSASLAVNVAGMKELIDGAKQVICQHGFTLPLSS